MGMFVPVCDWLQVDHEQREAIEPDVATAYKVCSPEGGESLDRPFNWPLYVYPRRDIKSVVARTVAEPLYHTVCARPCAVSSRGLASSAGSRLALAAEGG
jgi:hypothetical protein